MNEKGIGMQSLCLEDLYNLWGGTRELHGNLVGGGDAKSSKTGHDLLRIGMSRGLLARIFILLQTTSCYPVKTRYVARDS